MIDVFLILLLAAVGVLLWFQWRRDADPMTDQPDDTTPDAPPPTYYWRLTRQAGMAPDKAWPVYIGIKVVLAVLLPLIAWEVLWPGWWALILAPVGFLIPDAVINSIRRTRQDKIRRALSFFLDLLVSLLQAGLSLEEAFRRAAVDGLPAGHPLAEEALLVVAELDLGRDRTIGFQSLADRTGVKEMRALAYALGVGLSSGAPLDVTLKGQADLVRTKRREEGLRRLEMASAEVLLPLVLCSFPVFVVLVLAPLVMLVVESLQTFGRVLR